MKQLIFLLLSFPHLVFGKEIELKTNITEVTVFQAGAQVKRVGSTIIPIGESELVIRDATTLLKKESIQVKGEGDFTILSVNYESKIEATAFDEVRIKNLDLKETALIEKLEELYLAMHVLKTDEKTIMNLSGIHTGQQGVTFEHVVKAQEILHQKLTLISTEQLRISRLIDKTNEELKKTKQELSALRSAKENITNQVVVKVKSSKEVKADFTFNYIVPNARWFASYDLRVKTIDEPLLIEYKANVWQQTGEDWKNVKLKLSTGDPSQSSQKPKVSKWWLALNQHYKSPIPQSNYYKYTDTKITKISGSIYDEKTGEVLPYCNIFVPGTNIGTSSDIDGNFILALPENAKSIQIQYIGYQNQTLNITSERMQIYLQEDASQLMEVTVTSYKSTLISPESTGALYYKATGSDIKKSPNSRGSRSATSVAATPIVTPQENIINTEFVIEEKYTLLSQIKNTSVQIKSISVPANYQYFCAPRYDKDVFLTALVHDWEQYDLLEGNANVFFEGTFIGNTLLDTRYLKDTLEISLGRDKSILVDRVKSKDFNKRQFLGNDNISYRHWEITVRNTKKQKINLILEDQFPLSNDSRIEIRREEKSDGLVNTETGIITWQFEINSNENRKKTFKYSVKYPKGTFVGLD